MDWPLPPQYKKRPMYWSRSTLLGNMPSLPPEIVCKILTWENTLSALYFKFNTDWDSLSLAHHGVLSNMNKELLLSRVILFF